MLPLNSPSFSEIVMERALSLRFRILFSALRRTLLVTAIPRSPPVNTICASAMFSTRFVKGIGPMYRDPSANASLVNPPTYCLDDGKEGLIQLNSPLMSSVTRLVSMSQLRSEPLPRYNGTYNGHWPSCDIKTRCETLV